MRPKLRFEKTGARPDRPHRDSPSDDEPYICPEPLREAVNLAIHLGRPLLLEGEAGCGKTRLARAVAYQLGLPFYPWYVNSGTRVSEGLYTLDTLARLHDVQMRNNRLETKRDPAVIDEYIEYGALGKAFRMEDCRAVVLIDEIDKASIDFPNDLLTALDDDYKFRIPEKGQEISPKEELKPIIFITSNREKGDLPEPFLRRCLYFFVKFPDENALRDIVDVHYGTEPKNRRPSAKLVTNAIAQFGRIRESTRIKKPGTSEFLDWLEALQTFRDRPHSANDLKDDKPVLYPETLFKLKEDRDSHFKQFSTTDQHG